jgi:hypothetical protein
VPGLPLPDRQRPEHGTPHRCFIRWFLPKMGRKGGRSGPGAVGPTFATWAAPAVGFLLAGTALS